MSGTCPICGSHEGWRIPHLVDRDIEAWRKEAGDGRPYFWTLCRYCATGYPSVPPIAEVLARYWEANRTIEPKDEAERDAIRQQRIAIARIAAERAWAVLSPHLGGKTGRFLDIACGLGETVAMFQAQGFQAEGIDVDASTLPFHQRLGIATRIGRFEDDAGTDRYDVIQIAHAIYFIQEPLELLRRLRQRLNPGGRLLVVISDFLGSMSVNLPGYPHTFYPCRASMRFALARAGLRTIDCRKWGGSDFIVAEAGEVAEERVEARRILWLYRTQKARYALIGQPARTLARGARQLLKSRPT